MNITGFQKKNLEYKVIKLVRTHIDKLIGDVYVGNLFHEPPIIPFHPKVSDCCGIPLLIQKTYAKRAATLDIGEFIAKQTILACSVCGTIYKSQELQGLVSSRCKYGYDIVVYVGKAIFNLSYSNQKIINDLAEKNISISDREIAYLSKKFIIYLALAHRVCREQLKKGMVARGGYILHLDGTCEGDSPHLFTGLDGIAEIVLDNIKLPSEKADKLIPFFQRIKEAYGNPLALVHDMGKGILKAVKAVFPQVKDFICHFHFLRDLGKDLFEDEYKELRNTLKRYKIRSLLNQQAKVLAKRYKKELAVERDLMDNIKQGRIKTSYLREMPTVSTYALIHWTLDKSAESAGYGFPFDRVHFSFYQRIEVLHKALNQIKEIHLRDNLKDNKPFYRTIHLLDDLIEDVKCKQVVFTLQEKIRVFDKLREAMRIALPEEKQGLNDDGQEVDIKTIEERVKKFRTWLELEMSSSKGYQELIAQLDKYWEKLFTDPIKVETSEGEVSIQPQRTNNIMERLFRDLKRRYRKKTGTGSLGKTLKAMLADTPYVRNLENKEYLKIILNGCATLEERFAQIDNKLVVEELKSLRKTEEKLSPEMKKIIKQPNLPQIITQLFTAYAK